MSGMPEEEALRAIALEAVVSQPSFFPLNIRDISLHLTLFFSWVMLFIPAVSCTTYTLSCLSSDH